MKLFGTISVFALGQLICHSHASPLQSSLTTPDPSHETGQASLRLLAAAPVGNRVDRSGWKVICDSQENGNECSKAIDGDKGTFWHTAFTGGSPKPPHSITVDMGSAQNVNGLSVLPRQDGSPNGWIARHSVLLSADGQQWDSPVATGTWCSDNTEKFSNFEPKSVRYVRLVAVSEASRNPWTSVADLNIYRAATVPAPGNGMGRWGPTLDFPIVPVAGAVEPRSGKVLVWSAFDRDSFEGSPGGFTLTSTWDPATGDVTERNVTNIGHDMFCPGISLDGTGQIVVTGGSNAQKSSLYDSGSDRWVPGPDMKVPRGYQASATCSDGRVFTIGGSWSGGQFEKNGEIYDPSSKSWKMLPRAAVKPMLTADKQGIYRADNHGWLFGWRNGTVFQAGPSTAMNWYFTSGDGDVKPAGARASPRGRDPDSMCGDAVMYDATKGKILTVGGSPWYQDADATANAHIITIGDVGSEANVSFASNGMYHARIFHSSVVLPDGTVFITGGQSHGVPFADSTPQLTPELYDPEKDQFFEQQPNSIIRVYHSLALLLPDATVFNGGGGLCGSCTTNHFDAQIFSPRYLFDGDGKPATRPVIKSVSSKSVKAGGIVTITTDSPVQRVSLVRYGTATHTVNTDQRRIPLTPKALGRNKYTIELPGDLGILLPGYWMLFAMNEKGVPSIAATVMVLQQK